MKTNKFSLAVAVAIVASAAFSATHVPEKADSLSPIKADFAKKNHVLLVNVGDAVDAKNWGPAVTFAAQLFQINIWTNSIKSVSVPELVADQKYCQNLFGEKAKVCVFIVSNKDARPFLSAPWSWSIVNVRNLQSDNPDAQTLRDRYAKMILKGLALASCGGASIENSCSMYYNSFTLPGLDKAGITLAPMTYFPMLEILQRVGGPEIVRQDDGAEQ